MKFDNSLGYFKNQIEISENKLQELRKKDKRFAFLRLISFLAVVVLSVYFISNSEMLLFSIMLFISLIAFGYLLKTHQFVRNTIHSTTLLKGINQTEISRLKRNLSDIPGGEHFFDPKHPYHQDLDIFGKNSLYSLINRTTSKEGAELLANRLSNGIADNNKIVDIQKAIKELSPRVDWRQKLEVLGLSIQENQIPDSETLKTEKISTFRVITQIILNLLLVANIILVSLDIVDVRLLIINIIANIIATYTFISKTVKPANEAIIFSTKLNRYKNIFKHIESENFESELNTKLKTRLYSENISAGKSLEQLSSIGYWLENHGNQLYQIVNALFNIDLFIFIRLHRWFKNFRTHIPEWFEVMTEFEVLNSFAGFYYESEGSYNFAKITDEKYCLDITSTAHPLLKPGETVKNDFTMEGKGAIGLITGSNMSGKSTFLRTLGINMVLAYCGAPVIAEKLVVSRMQIFTSMRTQDSLTEHISAFYAELLRIKALLDEIEKGKPVFYLLDEILKGTNSDDRVSGSLALIKQLIKLNAMGLIATHDLQLSALEKSLPEMGNYHFSSEVNGKSINFDYKLKEGPCESFNAKALMKNMGIQLED
ncbi:hypothetical protein OO013_11925 [Mangrovivirga sp. M17]|uniref:DNA mismatch repair proteins mutS family domain-containing protein n=1 Tax=Mangrovivirga halotolerans TaxID=2993936 RepID=A0ABT3RTV8_9BACT|nr:hypothetical protein [Mangrovivirga halotolerans]MCX2744580.1 hypothetical protein [Mangrovivirga halotolerans]